MDRVAWQATVYGAARVGHSLATKQRQIELHSMKVPQLLLYGYSHERAHRAFIALLWNLGECSMPLFSDMSTT